MEALLIRITAEDIRERGDENIAIMLERLATLVEQGRGREVWLALEKLSPELSEFDETEILLHQAISNN